MSDQTATDNPLARTILVTALYLANGAVIKLNDPWPNPYGDEPRDDLDTSVKDENGEDRTLNFRVAQIFEVPEESLVDVSEDDAESSSVRKAHYEVWSNEPLNVVRMIEIPYEKVIWAEKLIPYSIAQSRVSALFEASTEPEDEEETPDTPATEGEAKPVEAAASS